VDSPKASPCPFCDGKGESEITEVNPKTGEEVKIKNACLICQGSGSL
jgi:hypothetical protein